MSARDHVKEDLGGFVLGALEPAEQDRVRRHLDHCEHCRFEHDRLATVAPALALLQPPHEPPTSLPANLEADVIRNLARRRHGSRSGWRERLARPGRRSVLAGALAGCGATLAILTLGGTFSDDAPPVQTIALTSPESSASASARMRTGAAGTQVHLQGRRLPPTKRGEIYEVWLVRGNGRVSAGTFTVATGGEISVTLTTAARPAGYDQIGVTREPDATDPARNGPNVLAGRLRRE